MRNREGSNTSERRRRMRTLSVKEREAGTVRNEGDRQSEGGMRDGGRKQSRVEKKRDRETERERGKTHSEREKERGRIRDRD